MTSLFEMTDLFLGMNHPNYAKWTVMYINNLIKLKDNDSEFLSEFKKDSFGVNRTNGSFFKNAVDLTLEQTINADATSSLNGVKHLTNSIAAGNG